MKPATVTTIIALVLAIPFIVKSSRSLLSPARSDKQPVWTSENQMYDIDDFLT